MANSARTESPNRSCITTICFTAQSPHQYNSNPDYTSTQSVLPLQPDYNSMYLGISDSPIVEGSYRQCVIITIDSDSSSSMTGYGPL
ncbi:hypothetical protein JTE90_023123 [Oedothorax gibbosus]|uniref:Uncharacterized protein n=1 Tax=Oedothorax gibbosus TaxID=931172 RepID=A0AAV6UP47_9ARAC|nr:hypothetical protein JTE90_023123 [Oedothorax gibbosus]